RRIAADWERIYGHPLYFLEAFVDPERYRGTCYRASNWVVMGRTTGRGKNDQTHRPNRSIKDVLGYARVSTPDQQTIPMQTRALREYAARRGWAIALQVKEIGSGASQRERREQLLEAARRREIDVVLVWRLDRWGRSVTDLLATLQELEHLGVGFVSLTEALDLTTPAGRALAALLAVFAEFEREILRERVRAGL